MSVRKDWAVFFSICGLFVAAGLIEQKTKVIKAKKEMELLVDGLQKFYVQTGNFPSQEQGLQVLNSSFVEKPVEKDPWGNSYEYFSKNKLSLPAFEDDDFFPRGIPFAVVCWGADGKKGGIFNEKDIVSWY